jgi:polyisoprenoid-binding protein YceI
MTQTTTTNLPLVPGTWTLDANHSTVAFTIRHLGISKVRGSFAKFDTEFVVDESGAATIGATIYLDSFDAQLEVGTTLEDTVVTATVDVASIDTANADRDAHVLSPDLLDVAARPTLAFRSTGIEGEGTDWVLHGELTVGEVTRPVSLDVELGGIETYPIDGSRHAGFEARGELRRKDFGIDFGMLDAALGQVVKFELDLQVVEPR